ncbi:hypothetical protein JTB14_024656 [Gonioctena quinquepunctata]|nr:hypothetical protein JTB14_024656 [Gonioctena quinquepunctata]
MPISRRPAAKKVPISPAKKLVQKPDSISRKGKLDKEGTTDSSTVSTPSADQDTVLKKDLSKLTAEEIQQLKAQELADLKEEQEAVKEIEAVFRKGELLPVQDDTLRKVKGDSIDEKLDKEEYLIIEKEEIEQESLNDKDAKENETQKLARDSEESEKRRKQSKDEAAEDKLPDTYKELNGIEHQVEDIGKTKVDTLETSKIASLEEKLDVSTDKKTNEKEIDDDVKDVMESHPDEKVSANIKSGDTTTAPTLPEDERIPLDEIKEDNGQVIEEKYVKEETKEKEIPLIQLPQRTYESISKLPGSVGIRLDKQQHIRDIVKTPDEVADLPVHEEVDYEYTHELKVETPKSNEILEKDTSDQKEEDKYEFSKEQKNEVEQEKDRDEVVQEMENVEKSSFMHAELRNLTNTVLENESILEKDILKDSEKHSKEKEKGEIESTIDENVGKTQDIVPKPLEFSGSFPEVSELGIKSKEVPEIRKEELELVDGKTLLVERAEEMHTEIEKEVKVKEITSVQEESKDEKSGMPETCECTEKETDEKKVHDSSSKHDLGTNENVSDKLLEPSLLNKDESKFDLPDEDSLEAAKEGEVQLEKLDEKLQQPEQTQTELEKHEIPEEGVDKSIEETTDEILEELVVEHSQRKPSKEFIEKIELGKKSPQERENDVIKIVASVAEVLKSDAPLEEFEGKIPITTSISHNIPFTTELRETHITTVDSPLIEYKVIKTDIPTIPEESHIASASFLEEERKMAGVHDSINENTEDKRSSLMKESQELLIATSKIISDIKSGKAEEIMEEAVSDQMVDEKQEGSIFGLEEKIDEEGSGIIHRMLVTASSEDGGEETEICPPGTIIFSRSSESSGRSSPDPSHKLSQKSSIVGTLSETLNTVEHIEELPSAKDSGIEGELQEETSAATEEKPKEQTIFEEKSKEVSSLDMSSGKSSPDKDDSIKSLASGKSTPDMSDLEKFKETESLSEDLKKAIDLKESKMVEDKPLQIEEAPQISSTTPEEEVKIAQTLSKEISDSTHESIKETVIHTIQQTADSDKAVEDFTKSPPSHIEPKVVANKDDISSEKYVEVTVHDAKEGVESTSRVSVIPGDLEDTSRVIQSSHVDEKKDTMAGGTPLTGAVGGIVGTILDGIEKTVDVVSEYIHTTKDHIDIRDESKSENDAPEPHHVKEFSLSEGILETKIETESVPDDTQNTSREIIQIHHDTSNDSNGEICGDEPVPAVEMVPSLNIILEKEENSVEKKRGFDENGVKSKESQENISIEKCKNIPTSFVKAEEIGVTLKDETERPTAVEVIERTEEIGGDIDYKTIDGTIDHESSSETIEIHGILDQHVDGTLESKVRMVENVPQKTTDSADSLTNGPDEVRSGISEITLEKEKDEEHPSQKSQKTEKLKERDVSMIDDLVVVDELEKVADETLIGVPSNDKRGSTGETPEQVSERYKLVTEESTVESGRGEDKLVSEEGENSPVVSKDTPKLSEGDIKFGAVDAIAGYILQNVGDTLDDTDILRKRGNDLSSDEYKETEDVSDDVKQISEKTTYSVSALPKEITSDSNIVDDSIKSQSHLKPEMDSSQSQVMSGKITPEPDEGFEEQTKKSENEEMEDAEKIHETAALEKLDVTETKVIETSMTHDIRRETGDIRSGIGGFVSDVSDIVKNISSSFTELIEPIAKAVDSDRTISSDQPTKLSEETYRDGYEKLEEVEMRDSSKSVIIEARKSSTEIQQEKLIAHEAEKSSGTPLKQETVEDVMQSSVSEEEKKSIGELSSDIKSDDERKVGTVETGDPTENVEIIFEKSSRNLEKTYESIKDMSESVVFETAKGTGGILEDSSQTSKKNEVKDPKEFVDPEKNIGGDKSNVSDVKDDVDINIQKNLIESTQGTDKSSEEIGKKIEDFSGSSKSTEKQKTTPTESTEKYDGDEKLEEQPKYVGESVNVKSDIIEKTDMEKPKQMPKEVHQEQKDSEQIVNEDDPKSIIVESSGSTEYIERLTEKEVHQETCDSKEKIDENKKPKEMLKQDESMVVKSVRAEQDVSQLNDKEIHHEEHSTEMKIDVYLEPHGIEGQETATVKQSAEVSKDSFGDVRDMIQSVVPESSTEKGKSDVERLMDISTEVHREKSDREKENNVGEKPQEVRERDEATPKTDVSTDTKETGVREKIVEDLDFKKIGEKSDIILNQTTMNIENTSEGAPDICESKVFEKCGSVEKEKSDGDHHEVSVKEEGTDYDLKSKEVKEQVLVAMEEPIKYHAIDKKESDVQHEELEGEKKSIEHVKSVDMEEKDGSILEQQAKEVPENDNEVTQDIFQSIVLGASESTEKKEVVVDGSVKMTEVHDEEKPEELESVEVLNLDISTTTLTKFNDEESHTEKQIDKDSKPEVQKDSSETVPDISQSNVLKDKIEAVQDMSHSIVLGSSQSEEKKVIDIEDSAATLNQVHDEKSYTERKVEEEPKPKDVKEHADIIVVEVPRYSSESVKEDWKDDIEIVEDMSQSIIPGTYESAERKKSVEDISKTTSTQVHDESLSGKKVDEKSKPEDVKEHGEKMTEDILHVEDLIHDEKSYIEKKVDVEPRSEDVDKHAEIKAEESYEVLKDISETMKDIPQSKDMKDDIVTSIIHGTFESAERKRSDEDIFTASLTELHDENTEKKVDEDSKPEVVEKHVEYVAGQPVEVTVKNILQSEVLKNDDKAVEPAIHEICESSQGKKLTQFSDEKSDAEKRVVEDSIHEDVDELSDITLGGKRTRHKGSTSYKRKIEESKETKEVKNLEAAKVTAVDINAAQGTISNLVSSKETESAKKKKNLEKRDPEKRMDSEKESDVDMEKIGTLLEKEAMNLEESFETMKGMSRSIVFERCGSIDKISSTGEHITLGGSVSKYSSGTVEDTPQSMVSGTRDTVEKELRHDGSDSYRKIEESEPKEVKNLELAKVIADDINAAQGTMSKLVSSKETESTEKEEESTEKSHLEKRDPEKRMDSEKESNSVMEQIGTLLEKEAMNLEETFETMKGMSRSIIFETCGSIDKISSTDEHGMTSNDANHQLDANKVTEELKKQQEMSDDKILRGSVEIREDDNVSVTTEDNAENSNIKDDFVSVSSEVESVEFEKGEEETMEKGDKKIVHASDDLQHLIIPGETGQKLASQPTENIITTLRSPSATEKSPTTSESEKEKILLHEKHIPGTVTPPTVPVSPSVLDETVKFSSVSPAPMKETDLRSTTPLSEDSEIIGSTHTDISSDQVSRIHQDKESDEEDQLSIVSQVAHSRDSSRCELDDEFKRVDPMSMSFYGSLPAETDTEQYVEPSYLFEITKAKYSTPSIDKTDEQLTESVDNPKQESSNASSTSRDEKDPLESWGKPLGLPAPSTHLYEITQAKFSQRFHEMGSKRKESVTDTHSDSEEDSNRYQFKEMDMMSASFYGDLPRDNEDPIAAWGKPLGLPSPAPPLDNKGTPKKEKKLPPNVTAKNKLNDDRKRAESPSKQNNKNKKITPVYVDLTYVPHHGNTYYTYVDFFKRVRARYYVFSGIEPSRDVYNALLEAKQTWEDKDLEVTIIPTYDTDILGFWVAENEEMLTKYKIDLSPSASRCTINLQDHETSCSAYRLEF